MRRGRLLLFGLLVSVSIAVGWSASALAFIAPFPVHGRGEFRGYFTDTYDCGGHDVWTEGIHGMTNANQFIDYIKWRLYNGDAQQRVGAKFIILTMLGGHDKNPASPNGAQIADWEQRVRYAESQGWISWNQMYTFNVNTMYQGPPTSSTEAGGGSKYGCPVIPNPPPNPVDDAYFPVAVQTDPSIVFRNPSTGQFYYALRIVCANPLGNLDGIPGLPQVDYNLQVNLQPGSDAPPWGGIIEAGKTYHLTPIVQNFGPGASFDSYMDVNNFQYQYVTVRNAATTGGWAHNQGYISGAPPNRCNYGPECWFWWYRSIPNGQIVTQPNGLTFATRSDTPDGQQVCFNAAIVPHNLANQPAFFPPPPQPALCYTVYKVHHPGIVSTNGDVHAGGDLCGRAQTTTGNIHTNPSNNSLNEYVVSANGVAGNFGSNNTVGGSAATVGRNGNYYSVCRPDLSAVAIDYLSVGVPGVDYTILPGGSYDVGALPAVPGNVYYFSGEVRLRGTFNRKMTIAAPSVIIDGNIILNAPSTSGGQAPSLGIITNGYIEINGGVTRVDAYLFADGSINTCADGNVPACANTLTVNGFLMANTLSFRRLGPANAASSATVGEQINLTGQIYLNPPKFFDNAAGENLLQHGGEKPPLN